MIEHPASYRLDALVAGDADVTTSEHVASCAACTTYVEALAAELRASAPSEAETDAFMAGLLTKPDAAVVPLRPRSPARLVPYATVLLAAAAAVFLYVRSAPAPGTPQEEHDSPTAVRFKGGVQLAVVRERDGVQDRFTDVALIRAGDRLRAEIATDQDGPFEIGILQTDGAYLPLLTPTALSLGTHFSDRAAKVDEHPLGGWVIAGHPDAVKHARETKDLARVRVIPIRVQ